MDVERDSPGSPLQPAIRVMSFNIRYGLAEGDEHPWEQRRSLVLARIRAFDADLLGMQECRDDAQAGFLRSHLPDYHFEGTRRGGEDEAALEMAPLLFRHAGFRLLDHGHFWLSQTPRVPGSKSWKSVFPRTVTWARLFHQPSGRPLVFANTHFDYQPLAVEKAAGLLRRWLGHYRGRCPLIVSGDFNADKESRAYRLLTGEGMLFDAYRRVHPPGRDEATFHAFGQAEARAPIDWILVSEHFEVVEAAVDTFQEGNCYPSDHYPLTAVLRWKE